MYSAQDGYWEFTDHLGTLLGVDVSALRKRIQSAGLKSLGRYMYVVLNTVRYRSCMTMAIAA